MNTQVRKPLRKIIQKPGAPGTPVQPATPLPPVGQAFLQPSTAFALRLASEEKPTAPAVQATSAPPTSPTASSQRVPEATLVLMQELSALLTEEMGLVKKQDIEGLKLLQNTKYKLINSYEANIRALKADPDLIRQTPDALRLKLKESGRKLDALAETNASVLKGAAQAVQRVLQNVIGMIREEALPKQTSYSNRIGSMTTAYSPLCPSVAVNRTA